VVGDPGNFVACVKTIDCIRSTVASKTVLSPHAGREKVSVTQSPVLTGTPPITPPPDDTKLGTWAFRGQSRSKV
jgi:hypothetical protein